MNVLEEHFTPIIMITVGVVRVVPKEKAKAGAFSGLFYSSKSVITLRVECTVTNVYEQVEVDAVYLI